MLADVRRSGSARGLVAGYSALGFLKLRLGALPEADAAARVALGVLQEGDFTPGLPFAATVLAMEKTIGLPKVVLADTGYASGPAVAALQAKDI